MSDKAASVASTDAQSGTRGEGGRALSIGVIETGLPPEEFAGRFPDYPHMVERWLSPALEGAKFAGIGVVRGEPLPAPDAFDAYVITGSRYGVYDDLAWIRDLESFVLAAGAASVPVFGICFGHQLLAQAYGARVTKSERGWGCGAQRYKLEGLAGERAFHAFHQDQVLDVPRTAELIGGNDFCPIGALRYRTPALSVQFHPEFEGDYVAALLDLRGGTTVPDDVTKAARASLSLAPDNSCVAELAADFITRSVAPAHR